jgi:bifunctional non-homologous end joining protein LigD
VCLRGEVRRLADGGDQRQARCAPDEPEGPRPHRAIPELVKALSGLKPKAFILDGEVAVYDRAFVSRFEWLRQRPTDEPATLPVYMVFDLLKLDGRDLRKEPLKRRRRLLQRFIGGHGMIFAVRRLSRNGLKAWEEAVARGFEGLVAKKPESRYVPGRTLAWLRIKQPHYREGERGWEPKR